LGEFLDEGSVVGGFDRRVHHVHPVHHHVLGPSFEVFDTKNESVIGIIGIFTGKPHRQAGRLLGAVITVRFFRRGPPSRDDLGTYGTTIVPHLGRGAGR
jgi:hypothetical protein